MMASSHCRVDVDCAARSCYAETQVDVLRCTQLRCEQLRVVGTYVRTSIITWLNVRTFFVVF
jgi:hypothetical protein